MSVLGFRQREGVAIWFPFPLSTWWTRSQISIILACIQNPVQFPFPLNIWTGTTAQSLPSSSKQLFGSLLSDFSPPSLLLNVLAWSGDMKRETNFHHKERVKVPGGNHAYLNLLLETMGREYGQKDWIPVARRVDERGDIDRSAARRRGMWRSSDGRGPCAAGCCPAAVHGEADGRGRRRGTGKWKGLDDPS